ncbi:MAG: dehydrogenase/GMP reductase [Fibrobacteres bacterium]|nr:dehydrogenase/GMP reductase [Fibrobacterota bacterium]
MAKILDDLSRTFSEYLLIPRLTRKEHLPRNVSLAAPIARFKAGEASRLTLNIPVVSASMQAVSGTDMGVALARQGGMAFVFCSQTIEAQAAMIAKIKAHKAGFVRSDSNVKPTATLRELLDVMKKTGHSTVPVTEDGSSNGRFMGIITDKDFWEFEDDLSSQVKGYMTPKEKVIHGTVGITLKEANHQLYKHKKEALPILEADGRLNSLVFKKDYVDHINNPLELLDPRKRLVAAAGINTHDYKERLPALVEAGVDVVSFDSSDGFSEFQKEASLWARERYADKLIIGGGNVVSAEGFRYLVEEAQLDFVKVGIGGGSICITREQKGIGRGQASALMEVVEERNRYFREKGVYIPICSDGGLANDTQIIIAMAMGADFVMMGRYFAMTNESPTPKVSIKGRIYKPYWGEGSNRARNWERYVDEKGSSRLHFEEGVDGYVPVVGSVNEVLAMTLEKMRATMCNLGSKTLAEFTQNAVLTLVSEQSIEEGGTSNIIKVDSKFDDDT